MELVSRTPVVAITGTTHGIGKAIVDTKHPERYAIMELNRPDSGTTLGDPSYLNMIIPLIVEDANVFVNNVYGGDTPEIGEDPNPQLTLFQQVLKAWSDDPTKTIINIGSGAARYASTPVTEPNVIRQRRYRQNKNALHVASEQAAYDYMHVRCRVSVIGLGYVRTQRTDFPRNANKAMMTPEEAAKYIWWVIDQPQNLRIPTLSVFAVGESGLIDTGR